MAGPWLTNLEVKTAIAKRLGKAVGDLETWADDVASQANLDTTADITTIMLGLGYSIGQVDDWDFVATYAMRLALWYAFNQPPLRTDMGEAAERPNDPREALRTMTAIVIDGEAVVPPNDPVVGGTSTGLLTAPGEVSEELREDWFR